MSYWGKAFFRVGRGGRMPVCGPMTRLQSTSATHRTGKWHLPTRHLTDDKSSLQIGHKGLG